MHNRLLPLTPAAPVESALRSTLQECQKCLVDLIRVNGGKTMRSAGEIDFLRALNQLGGLFRRVLASSWDSYDLFVEGSVHQQVDR